MDKDNLYYIVQKGTNSRVKPKSKNVLIVDADNVDRVLEEYGDLHEKITLTDYNKRFKKEEKK